MKKLLLLCLIFGVNAFASPSRITNCKQAAIAEAIKMESAVCGGEIGLLRFIGSKDLGLSKYGHRLTAYTFEIFRESTDPVRYSMTMEAYPTLTGKKDFCARVAVKSTVLD